MAKERLTLYDKYGNEVDYDVSTEDVTLDNEGGKSLKTKLTELDDADDAAVKKVTFNGNQHNVNGGEINIGNQMQPDWNETSPTYPTFIKNKPSVVTGIKVGASGSTITPTNGVVTLPEPSAQVTVDTDMSETSENAVQNKVIKAYVDAVSQRIDTLIGSGNVQGAIDTFNEVVAFLNGINSSDTLAAKLALKANTSDLQNYATKNELTSGLSGKQDTLTFDTTPTTGHTTQVMSSDSIKTAISLVTPTIDENGKWRIGGVSTNHDAHGPMGNITIEDGEDMVALIVNDLTTGGQANFLSAEMGKALLSVLLQIFGNLGEYAFPNGKPTLNFNTQISFPISYSQSDLHVTYADGQGGTAPSTVELLGRLEIQLGTDNNLYVINESAVKVFVGGTEVANAYDPTTDKIVIPEVYGNVVIIAQAWTYARYNDGSDDMVLFLDGKNRGGTVGGVATANHWKSLVEYNGSPIDFTLTSCDESHDDYVGFDGQNSKGIGSVSLLDVAAASGSIESVYGGVELNSQACVIMHNAWGTGSRIVLSTGHTSSMASGINGWFMSSAVNGGSAPSNVSYNNVLPTDIIAGHYISCVQGAFLFGGENLTPANDSNQAANANSMLSLFYRKTSNDMFFKGNLYALRVYSDKLTPAEQKQNYKVDKKRFNL